MPEEKLCMKFDMNTIQHLGIQMYTKLPPVIVELIANAWDADAGKVTIELSDSAPENKWIIVKDNGHGMTSDEINQKFLVIGRNRRVNENKDTTPNGRKVIGRKGIGKLSVFGIADDIVITTCKNGIRNVFELSLPGIRTAEKEYYPKHSVNNEPCEDGNGTTIALKKLKRKSPLGAEGIAVDLARRFLIFDEKFQVQIIHNGDDENRIDVTNELRFKNIEKEFTWTFPNENLESDYADKSKVTGEIFAAMKPVSSSRGISSASR